MNTLLAAFATRLQTLFTRRDEIHYEQFLKRSPMQSIELKVKIKSLAAEARIIKQEEQKALRHVRALREYYSQRNTPLVADSVIPKARDQYVSLHNHRVVQVRAEARHSGLAYGFLRGTPYRRIEAKCHVPPNWVKVQSMIARFAGWQPLINRTGVPDRGSNEPAVCNELKAWFELPAEPGHQAADDGAVEEQHLQALAPGPVVTGKPAAGQQQQRA
jgi:hypothetical protein